MIRKQLCVIVTVAGWLFGATSGMAQTAPSDGRALNHVFPLLADGKLNDGTSYRSSVLVTSVVPETATAHCDVNLVGMTTNFVDVEGTITTVGSDFIDGGGLGGWYEAHTQGTAAFKSGYYTVGCTTLQTAQVTYSFYGANGLKLSESTAFSSAPGTRLQLFADQREGSRLGVAIANNTAAPVPVAIGVFGITQPAPIAAGGVTIPPMSTSVKFLDEILPALPRGQVGIVQLRAPVPIYAIGMRFTGAAFTTIPASALIP